MLGKCYKGGGGVKATTNGEGTIYRPRGGLAFVMGRVFVFILGD